MERIWIIGAGGIAIEYAKVLKALGKDFIVIGRGEESARKFEDATGAKPIIGGLESFLATSPDVPAKAINCVRAQDLGKTNIRLMQYGLPCVLTEKPGFYPFEMEEVEKEYRKSGSRFYIAYNRRFYASVLAAEKVIEEDGGLLSFNFEFTEWKHIFDRLPESVALELHNLFVGNSSHVVDLAFFLGGEPKEITCFSNGTVGWHTPANFAGAGVTKNGVLFNYCANWNAPGRWAVELLTAKHRIYLKPMEQLQLQDIATVKVYPVEIDDYLDKEFKPGFYLETKAFIEGDYSRLCSLEQQVEHIKTIYNKMLGVS
jgi:predicted dehydrogenase